MARVCGYFWTKPWSNSDIKQLVRIWRAGEAETLGMPSLWMFPYWDTEHDYEDGVIFDVGGFIEGWTLYNKGQPNPNAFVGGPCGRPGAWAEGAILPLDPPLTWRNDYFSTCCKGLLNDVPGSDDGHFDLEIEFEGEETRAEHGDADMEGDFSSEEIVADEGLADMEIDFPSEEVVADEGLMDMETDYSTEEEVADEGLADMELEIEGEEALTEDADMDMESDYETEEE